MFRSFGLSVLGALAAVLGVLHAFDVLVYLGLVLAGLPGESAFFGFNWVGALVAGVVAWIWFWAAVGLWRADPQAWEFVVAVSLLTLVFGGVALMAGAPWAARAPSMTLAVIALCLALLPGTRHAMVPTTR